MAEREKDRRLRKTELPTLYWNPSLETDKNGEAVIRFKNPEHPERVNLLIETLTPDGKVGSYSKTF